MNFDEKAIEAGNQFGHNINNVKKTALHGLSAKHQLLFSCTEIGVQMAAIVGWMGKDAALAILDTVRKELVKLPEPQKH